MKSYWPNIAITVLIVAVIGLIGYVIWTRPAMPVPSGTNANTNQNANANLPPAGWLTKTDPATGLKFSYPPSLFAAYIRLVDWPPTLRINDEGFACTPGGAAGMPAGLTQPKSINGHAYCVTQETQGAAGTIYTQYAYAFAKGDGTAIMTFSVALPQCGNYPDPQKTACDKEKAAFDIGPTIDAVAQSLK